MKQKYFSLNLFWDFFKQIKLTGIILTAVLCIITAVPTLAQYITNGRYINEAVQISQVTPVLYFVIYFIPIIYTAGIFKFLNKRRDSDFYHSLPPTRLCMYFSGCLASFCWSLITIISMVLIGYLSLIICSLSCPAVYIGYLTAYNAVVALIITGCACIALSATGTLLPGLCLTLIIMFLPRLILTLINIMVRDQSIIASALNDGLLFNQNYNFVTAPLFSAIASGNSNAANLPAFAGGYIYTGVLGLIYILLGALAFRARKSESAEKSAPNRALQHIYRLLISLPTLLAAAVLITSNSDESLVVILIVLSVIIYFVYEAITTKSFKSMLKAAPLFLADIAVCAIVCLASYGISQNILNDTPQADEVNHIEINVSNSDGYYVTPSYTQALQATIEYKNKDIVSLACEQLDKTAQTAKAIKNDPRSSEYISGRSVTFVLNSGTKITRTVDFGSAAAQFENLLWSEPAYVENLIKLPSDSQISSIGSYSTVILTQDQFRELWESYKTEYAALSNEAKAEAKTQDYSSSPFYINLTGTVGLTVWSDRYAITSLTPNTFKAAAQYANQQQPISQFKEKLQSVQEITEQAGNYEVNIDIGFYNTSQLDIEDENLAAMFQGGYSASVYSYHEEYLSVMEILNNCTMSEAKPDQPVLTLDLMLYEQDVEYGYSVRSDENHAVVSIDQESLTSLINLLFQQQSINAA